ncbi:MAG TPA: hypothetical protein VH643_23115 [Gemmataceae bacterium]
MSRNSKTTTVKPQLEQLEERSLPSFLINGLFTAQGPTNVQNLATPLNNMVKDMQSAQTDLNAQFAILNNPANKPGGATPLGFNQAEQVAGKMIADWQRIVTDNAAITAVSNADQAFIRQAAIAEFGEGDQTDAVIVFLTPLFKLNTFTALTTPVTQANTIATDPTLLSIVGMNLNSVNTFVDSTAPITSVTVVPTF